MPSLTPYTIVKDSSLLQQGLACGYDQQLFRLGEEAVNCPSCGAPHHRTCWEANDDKCTVLGCAGAGPVSSAQPIWSRPTVRVLASIGLLAIALFSAYSLLLPINDIATLTAQPEPAPGIVVSTAASTDQSSQPNIPEPTPAPLATIAEQKTEPSPVTEQKATSDVISTEIPATNPPTPNNEETTLIAMKIADSDQAVQVLVPEGNFLMGSDPGDSLADEDEFPQRMIFLSEFWIDRVEVTNQMYAQCVTAGSCNAPREQSSHSRESYYGNPEYAVYPVIFVSWSDAATYCEWAGRRLPTEAEWEKAARGSFGSIFPWGNRLSDNRANFCDRSCTFNWRDETVDDEAREIASADSYPDGASPYGALNMAGNVYEWVQDWYESDYLGIAAEANPPASASGTERVLRGGSWFDAERFVRAANRVPVASDLFGDNIGFRCVEEPQ